MDLILHDKAKKIKEYLSNSFTLNRKAPPQYFDIFSIYLHSKTKKAT